MKIGVASDHGGLDLKNEVKKYLQKNGYDVSDYGTYTNDSVDYPDFAEKLSKALLAGEFEKGILFCGTGIGISIAANKIKGIYCGLIYDEFTARMAARHNNCNIVAIGGRTIGPGKACEMAKSFLSEKFEGERHENRIAKIKKLENE